MTIVSSGAISINSLVGEYGGSTPHSMSEYYKGGSLVLNHSNNANVPTSGTIQLDDFYGQSNAQPFDATLAGTCGQTSESGKGFANTHTGINTGRLYVIGVNHTTGSWSDASFTNTSGGTSFTVRTFTTINRTLHSVQPSIDVEVDLSGNYNGQTFSAATGWRYIKIGSTTYFDSNLTANNVGTSTTGTYISTGNYTVWKIERAANTLNNILPSSGSITLTLSN